MNRNANYSVRERMANRFAVDQRAALFNTRFKPGDHATKRNDDMYAASSREMMERQNDAQIEDLEAKVSTLKNIAGAIGRETRESNSLLENMGETFDKAGVLLKGTLGHLKTMMQQKNGKHMCYMVAFVMLLFFLMYFLRGMGSRNSAAVPITLQENSTVDSTAGN
mmetsp:Transcript_57461/g.159038  ORF Transcript_57461/g.159038 Transcript_57461/m.159038 type:complete len:166 (-) Transcript_57461:206-703(-)